jgi:2-C-methyl-D-erythritol 4-phosphate cytidylyltransferase
LRELGGQPLLVHAVHALASARAVDLVVVAAPENDVAAVRALLDGLAEAAEVRVVAGGPTRQASVARALQELPDDVDVVLVHDAARPLAPSELVDSVAATVRAGTDAVVPALTMPDTVKQVDAAGRVEATLDRANLRAVQTPQGFRRDVLEAAHAAAQDGDGATDDAGLVERLGRTVLVVAGAEEAFKVTRPLDLLLAEAVLARRRSSGVG